MSIFAWGCGKCVEFLDSDAKRTDRWEPVDLLAGQQNQEGLSGQSIISIASGDGHSLVATDSGDVYAFGRNNFGQLGSRSSGSIESFKKIISLHHEKIVKVAAGSNASFAITDMGKVYRFGLIPVAANIKNGSESEAAQQAVDGRMIGMANDSGFQVPVDADARAAQSSLLAFTATEGVNVTQYEARELSSIFEESSSRWYSSPHQFSMLTLFYHPLVLMLPPSVVLRLTVPITGVQDAGISR